MRYLELCLRTGAVVAAEEAAPLPVQIGLVIFFLAGGIWTIYETRKRGGSGWDRRLTLIFGYVEILLAIYLTVILILWY